MQMGPHCVWSNDSSTDMEALRLDFPDSFPPECAEDDLHDTTPEVPIPCMARLLEKEIKANEEIQIPACRYAHGFRMHAAIMNARVWIESQFDEAFL